MGLPGKKSWNLLEACFILFCRLCTLSKGLLAPSRGLTQGSQNPEKQRVFHIHEGKHGCLPFRPMWGENPALFTKHVDRQFRANEAY